MCQHLLDTQILREEGGKLRKGCGWERGRKAGEGKEGREGAREGGRKERKDGGREVKKERGGRKDEKKEGMKLVRNRKHSRDLGIRNFIPDSIPQIAAIVLLGESLPSLGFCKVRVQLSEVTFDPRILSLFLFLLQDNRGVSFTE